MVRCMTLATFLCLMASPGATAQEWARKMFKVTSHDFGTVARGAKAEFAFELTNLYEEDIHISSVSSSCGCTTASVTQRTLKTWEKSHVVATYNTHSFLGSKSATISVIIDQPFYAEVQLSVTGNIRGDVVFQPGKIDFGSIGEGEGAVSQVRVSYAGRPDWQITDVRSTNGNLGVELKEVTRLDGRVDYDMIVRLSESTAAGYLRDELTLVTNDHSAQRIPLLVEGRVRSAVTVSPASLFLGVLTPGQQVTKTLVVRGQKPFKVVDICCDDECFKFKATSDAKALHVIPVTFTAGHHGGKVAEAIQIKTDLGAGAAANCVATATIKDASQSARAP